MAKKLQEKYNKNIDFVVKGMKENDMKDFILFLVDEIDNLESRIDQLEKKP